VAHVGGTLRQTAEIKDPAISGGVADGKVRLVIEGLLSGQAADKDKLIFSTSLQHWIKADRDKLTQHLEATFNILQGDAKELPLTITGEGDIKQITGEALQDWSIRQEPNGVRTLLLRPKKGDKPLTQLAVVIIVERELKSWKNPLPDLRAHAAAAGAVQRFCARGIRAGTQRATGSAELASFRWK
jgi:hypothetical protein